MRKNGLTILSAVLLIAGVTAGNAYSGGKGGHEEGDGFGKGGHKEGGSFEAPFVDLSLPAQVLGSEGEIKASGSFEVEIPNAPAGTYKICLNDAAGSTLLATVTLFATGTLESEGSAGTSKTFVAPNFQVFTGGVAGVCDGTPMFQSGLTTG